MSNAKKVLILYRNHHPNSMIAMRILFDKIRHQIEDSISDEHETISHYNPLSKLIDFTIADREDWVKAMPFELFGKEPKDDFNEIYIDENCFEILDKGLFAKHLNRYYAPSIEKRVFSVKNKIISIKELTNN